MRFCRQLISYKIIGNKLKDGQIYEANHASSIFCNALRLIVVWGASVGKSSLKSKVQVFDTPQVSTVLRSNLMRLYFPVDLTGNLIMIDKLVFIIYIISAIFDVFGN